MICDYALRVSTGKSVFPQAEGDNDEWQVPFGTNARCPTAENARQALKTDISLVAREVGLDFYACR